MNQDNENRPSSETTNDTDRASKPAAGGRRIGRRAVIKASAATVAGIALGTTYLKPGLISIGVQEVYAFSYETTSQQTTLQTQSSSSSTEESSSESTDSSGTTETSSTTTTETSSSEPQGGGPKDRSSPSQGKKAPVDK
jgi:hypothetical protein